MDRFDEALEKYRETFGENYPICITTELSEEEMLKEIAECIASGKPAEGLDFDPNCDY